ncbi:hypothetical protein V8G54_024778 [Vigna mungo]|uniref:Retrotransposon gag domain-containing protein n=1 Tax=Vigna mungo TaxID=3915 RepID=A0AAQ3N6W6_VIGMU
MSHSKLQFRHQLDPTQQRHPLSSNCYSQPLTGGLCSQKGLNIKGEQRRKDDRPSGQSNEKILVPTVGPKWHSIENTRNQHELHIVTSEGRLKWSSRLPGISWHRCRHNYRHRHESYKSTCKRNERCSGSMAELGHHEQFAQHSALTIHRNQHRENENHDHQTSQCTNWNDNQHANPNGNQHGNPNDNERGGPAEYQGSHGTDAGTITGAGTNHTRAHWKHAEEIAALRAELDCHEQSAQHSAMKIMIARHPNVLTRTVTNMVVQTTMKEEDIRSLCKPFGPLAYSPFTVTIMQTPMPEKSPFAPDNHLRIFTNAMAFYTESDPVICRALSLSLKDEALECYNILPRNSVDCFATVETLFRRKYSSNRKQKITPAELVNTKQEKGETLKAFMNRYTETAWQVKDVNHSFIINNLPSFLRPRYFAEKLYAHPPKTMDELQERAVEFIRIEDMRISQGRQQEADVGGGRKDDRRSFSDRGGGSQPKDFDRELKFDYYTLVNAPRAKILREALSDELLSVRKLYSPKNDDKGKHCQYHQNLGHTTGECATLKDKIEALIRAGHLHKYVQKEQTRLRSLSRSPWRKMNEGTVEAAAAVAALTARFEDISTRRHIN